MNELLDAGALAGLVALFATAGFPKKDLGLLALGLAVVLEVLNAWHISPSPDYAQAIVDGIKLGGTAAAAFTVTPRVVEHTLATGSAVKSAVARRPRVSVASPLRVTRAPEAPPAVWETPATQ